MTLVMAVLGVANLVHGYISAGIWTVVAFASAAIGIYQWRLVRRVRRRLPP